MFGRKKNFAALQHCAPRALVRPLFAEHAARPRAGAMSSSPNQLSPEVFEDYCMNVLRADVNQVTQRDLSELQTTLRGALTPDQAALLHREGGDIATELGRRTCRIEAGMSALLVLDEIVGRRLAIQLDAMGYRGERVAIYDADGQRHEISLAGALALLPACREMDMPSTITVTGIELAPGGMTPSLSVFPIVEVHSLSVGPGAPRVEAISPIIYTGSYVQVQALSLTKASEISRAAGSVMASGHGGIRSRRYDGHEVDVGLPGSWRHGYSCTEEEAKEWARELAHDTERHNSSDVDVEAAASGPPGVLYTGQNLGPDSVVFLCRVLEHDTIRFPVL